MKVFENVYEMIGRTPILRATKTMEKEGLLGELFVKLEGFNPTGSVKDRASIEMIEDAERKGILKRAGTIIEPTSGNTGIGLASVAKQKGYETILTMPSSMSVERVKMLKAYGAKIVLTDPSLGMQGAIDEAKRIFGETENAFMPMQFDNGANIAAHEKTTAIEIFEDMRGEVDAFVAGVGTGGTVSGTGRALKGKIDGLKVFAVEPKSSPMITEGRSGKHGIQGIGANFVPKNYLAEIVDEVIVVSDSDAMQTARKFGMTEGILVGISSGASLFAAIEILKREEMKGKKLVVISPDGGEKYLSTPLYDFE